MHDGCSALAVTRALHRTLPSSRNLPTSTSPNFWVSPCNLPEAARLNTNCLSIGRTTSEPALKTAKHSPPCFLQSDTQLRKYVCKRSLFSPTARQFWCRTFLAVCCRSVSPSKQARFTTGFDGLISLRCRHAVKTKTRSERASPKFLHLFPRPQRKYVKFARKARSQGGLQCLMACIVLHKERYSHTAPRPPSPTRKTKENGRPQTLLRRLPRCQRSLLKTVKGGKR